MSKISKNQSHLSQYLLKAQPRIALEIVLISVQNIESSLWFYSFCKFSATSFHFFSVKNTSTFIRRSLSKTSCFNLKPKRKRRRGFLSFTTVFQMDLLFFLDFVLVIQPVRTDRGLRQLMDSLYWQTKLTPKCLFACTSCKLFIKKRATLIEADWATTEPQCK